MEKTSNSKLYLKCDQFNDIIFLIHFTKEKCIHPRFIEPKLKKININCFKNIAYKYTMYIYQHLINDNFITHFFVKEKG